MEPCPTCGRVVEKIHPLPPEVITKELLDSVDGTDSPSDLGTCVDCLEKLMRAGTLS